MKPKKRKLVPALFKPKGSIFEGLEWHVPNSKGTGTYTVSLDAVGFECDCPGFSFRGACKHSQQVLTRIEEAIDGRYPRYRSV